MAMNTNFKEMAKVLESFEEGTAFAREVLDKIIASGSKRTFNSVNATLAAMATKGYTTKAKAVCGDKILTKYKITDKAVAELDA